MTCIDQIQNKKIAAVTFSKRAASLLIKRIKKKKKKDNKNDKDK